MTWRFRLTVWWMRFATRLANWMLSSPARDSLAASHLLTVRILSKNGCIVRTCPAATLSQWPPLVHQLTSTEKRSITWFLLQTINATSDSPGSIGVVNGEEPRMWFTLSFQAPARG